MVASCWLFLNNLYYDARIHEHQGLHFKLSVFPSYLTINNSYKTLVFVYFVEVVNLLQIPILVFRRYRKIAKSDFYLRHVCPPARPSVRLLACKNSARLGSAVLCTC